MIKKHKAKDLTDMLLKRIVKTGGAMITAAAMVFLAACASSQNQGNAGLTGSPASSEQILKNEYPQGKTDNVRSAVDFDHELDRYEPKKDHYDFYFTYKTVHPWWDAVALGMEEAQRQFLDKGIVITYEYMAPDGASAVDQTKRLFEAAEKGYDVIGVDVADEAVISPILDTLVEDGKKVMTFSSSDAKEGCKRIAYVGNTHNYQDGVDLTEALCKKLDYKGKVAILVGSVGAPCHEERA